MKSFIEIKRGTREYLVSVIHQDSGFYLEAVKGRPWHQFGSAFDHSLPQRKLLERGAHAIQRHEELIQEFQKENHPEVEKLIHQLDT